MQIEFVNSITTPRFDYTRMRNKPLPLWSEVPQEGIYHVRTMYDENDDYGIVIPNDHEVIGVRIDPSKLRNHIQVTR